MKDKDRKKSVLQGLVYMRVSYFIFYLTYEEFWDGLYRLLDKREKIERERQKKTCEEEGSRMWSNILNQTIW